MYKYISDLPRSTTTLSILVISSVPSVFPLDPLGGNTTLKWKIEEELLEEEEPGASVEEGVLQFAGFFVCFCCHKNLCWALCYIRRVLTCLACDIDIKAFLALYIYKK